MARRRTNVYPLQPPRLLEFNPADWRPATGLTAWQRWSDARFDYLLKHRNQKLGRSDLIDVVYEEPPSLFYS